MGKLRPERARARQGHLGLPVSPRPLPYLGVLCFTLRQIWPPPQEATCVPQLWAPATAPVSRRSDSALLPPSSTFQGPCDSVGPSGSSRIAPSFKASWSADLPSCHLSSPLPPSVGTGTRTSLGATFRPSTCCCMSVRNLLEPQLPFLYDGGVMPRWVSGGGQPCVSTDQHHSAM